MVLNKRATHSWPRKREELKTILWDSLRQWYRHWPSYWLSEGMQKDLVSLRTTGCQNISTLHWSHWHQTCLEEWETVNPLYLQPLFFFPCGLAIKALWTGFCSYPVNLCKSPFRGPVCSSNSTVKKAGLNQTNTHLPSTFLPYHLLILRCNCLSLCKHHGLLSSVFLCGQIWPSSRDLLKTHLYREPSGLYLFASLIALSFLSAHSTFY